MTTATPCPNCQSTETRYRAKRGEWICDDCDERWTVETPNACPPLKLFLSYGHDQHTVTALRIKADLEAHGYRVWFDVERLREGRDWDRYIEEGLAWCDKVVLLMTPYSVRRRNPRDPDSRDGYCLNEIAKAIEMNRLIVPVMLATLDQGPPTSICRIQYLDLRDAVPIEENEERYKLRFERLVKALEDDDLDFEGGQLRLAKILRPLSFHAEMSRHIASFTGRLWLLGELDQWLESSSGSRVFWLVGGPGIGKTAVATYLAHRRHEVIGHHFCVYGHADKGDAASAVLSLAYQMAQQLPEYGKRLANIELEREVIKNPGTLFDNLVVEPLSRDFPAPDGPRLVVIDAIDEATSGGRNAIAELIRDHWAKTPSWLRLVVTSRQEAQVVSTLTHLSPLVLDAQGAENREDLARFLAKELSVRRIETSESLLGTILDKSEGMFLYARVLLDEIDQGRLTLEHPNELPVGLFGHYQRFFARQMSDTERYSNELRPLLEVVCAGRAPVPMALIAKAAGASGLTQVRERLAEIGSLLSVRPPAEVRTQADSDTVAPFHKSLGDWLTAIDKLTRLPVAGPYAINITRGRQCLADAVGVELKADLRSSSAYSLRHGPGHLVIAGRAAEAVEVLTEFGYHYERLRVFGGTEVVNIAVDLVLTDGVAGLALEARERLHVWKAFHAENAHILQREDAHLLPQTALLQLAVADAVTSPITVSAEHWLESQGSDAYWLRSLSRPHAVARGACLRTFEGHASEVTAVALLPDGCRAVSGSQDSTVKLWDLETGQCLHTLNGHTSKVTAVALLPDRRRALSGSLDSTVKLWDLEAGYCLRTLEGHTSGVLAVAFLPDGCRAVSGSQDHTLKLWDLNTGKCVQTLKGHTSTVCVVAVSCDGRFALSGSGDHTVKLWNLETGQYVRTLEGHTSTVAVVALSRDGRRAVSGSWDATLKLWDLETGRCLRTLEGHTNWVETVALLPDGRLAISSSFDATLKLWDLETGRCVQTLGGHTNAVLAVALLPDRRRALSGSLDSTVKLWDLETGQCLCTLEGHTSPVHAIALSSDGCRAVSGSDDKTLKLWNLETGVCPRERHTSPVCAVAISFDGRRAVSGSWDATLKLWDLKTGQCLHTFAGHTSLVNAVAFSSYGRHALSGSWDATLKLWDLETGQCLRTLKGHMKSVEAVALSPDGRCALSGSLDHTLKLWDLETGQCLHTLEGHTDAVGAVALSPDCHRALSGSWDHTLKLWDLETGQCLRTLKGHTFWVKPIAFLPDGDRALSAGSLDKTLKLWDLETGQCLRTFEGHSRGVQGVVLLPDGRRALSGSYDETLKLWDFETGLCLHTFKGHKDGVKAVALSSDGHRGASGSYDWTLKLWDLHTGLCLATWRAGSAVWCCAVSSEVIVGGTRGGEVFFLKLIPPGRVLPETAAAT